MRTVAAQSHILEGQEAADGKTTVKRCRYESFRGLKEGSDKEKPTTKAVSEPKARFWRRRRENDALRRTRIQAKPSRMKDRDRTPSSEKSSSQGEKTAGQKQRSGTESKGGKRRDVQAKSGKASRQNGEA